MSAAMAEPAGETHSAHTVPPSAAELRTLRTALIAGRLARRRGGFWTPLDEIDPSLASDASALRSAARIVASCFERRWLRPVPTERLPLLEATPAGVGIVLLTFDDTALAAIDIFCAIPPEQCRMLGIGMQAGVLRRSAPDRWIADAPAAPASDAATPFVTDALIGTARERSWIEPFDADGRTVVLMPAAYRAATLAASRGAAFVLAAETRRARIIGERVSAGPSTAARAPKAPAAAAHPLPGD